MPMGYAGAAGHMMSWEKVQSLCPNSTARINSILAEASLSADNFGQLCRQAEMEDNSTEIPLLVSRESAISDFVDEAISDFVDELDGDRRDKLATAANRLYDAYIDLKIEFGYNTTVGGSSLSLHISYHNPDDGSFTDSVRGMYCAIGGHLQPTPAGYKFQDDIRPYSFVIMA